MTAHLSTPRVASSTLAALAVAGSLLLVAPLAYAQTQAPAGTPTAKPAASTAKPAATTAKPAGTPAANANRQAAPKSTNAQNQQNRRRAAAAAAAPEPVIAAADAGQLDAAREVMLGDSNCEFGQRINVANSDKHAGYMDLSFKNRNFLMKPVLSSTGALRLEDVRAETLLIQIGNKTMLMNQKTGQRLVDNCIHPQHQAVASTQGSSLGIAAPAK